MQPIQIRDNEKDKIGLRLLRIQLKNKSSLFRSRPRNRQTSRTKRNAMRLRRRQSRSDGYLADSVLENGGEVLGVIPRFMIDEGWCHKGLTETIVTADMHERKERMAQEADAVIALPGGCGTMEELFEIITWKQLGLFLNPIVILNIDGYYNPLIEMLHNAIGENFMRQEHARMWQVAQTPQEAVDAIQNMPVWDKNIRKIAAI